MPKFSNSGELPKCPKSKGEYFTMSNSAVLLFVKHFMTISSSQEKLILLIVSCIQKFSKLKETRYVGFQVINFFLIVLLLIVEINK